MIRKISVRISVKPINMLVILPTSLFSVAFPSSEKNYTKEEIF